MTQAHLTSIRKDGRTYTISCLCGWVETYTYKVGAARIAKVTVQQMAWRHWASFPAGTDVAPM
jgi:hypothetical protein